MSLFRVKRDLIFTVNSGNDGDYISRSDTNKPFKLKSRKGKDLMLSTESISQVHINPMDDIHELTLRSNGDIILPKDTHIRTNSGQNIISANLNDEVVVAANAVITVNTNTNELMAGNISTGTLHVSSNSEMFGSLNVLGEIQAWAFSGDIIGNVTGNVTGNLTGDVTGNLTGDVTGNVTGDVTGNVTGNLIGIVGSLQNANAGTFTTVSADGILVNSLSVVTDATIHEDLSVNGDTTLTGNLSVSGNLTVTGTTTTVNATNLEITDPLIYIATGNSANLNDIGIVATHPLHQILLHKSELEEEFAQSMGRTRDLFWFSFVLSLYSSA